MFLRDRRSLREPTTVKVSPIAEFDNPVFRGPYRSNNLPFPEPISMTIALKVSRIPVLGAQIDRQERTQP
jgi:hypothetical protein